MIFQVVCVVTFFMSSIILTTLAMPQKAPPDPFSESARWFEEMASTVNKDFKPTFQDQPNSPFQAQQDPAAQAASMDTQPKADVNLESEISFITPEEVSYYIFSPGFTWGPYAGYPCPNPEQPNTAPQDPQNAQSQAQPSQEFQAKQDPVSQGQQNVDFQHQQNAAQTNPGVQGQQNQNQAGLGFQNPFL